MKHVRGLPDSLAGSPAEVEWTATVVESLPNCPSVGAGWERLAAQTRWPEWRSASEMRTEDVVTTLVPPASEPLETGDEYVVRVSRFMKIRCRVLESSTADGPDAGGEMVFDAVGCALGGAVKARFRFTVFKGEDGVVMARAREKVESPSFLTPSKETLENEHRHTFKDLNESFFVSLGA